MLPTRKPRLVFFRNSQEGLPFFIKLHLEEQIKCLSIFFEVMVIDYECDYGEICGRFEPELCLFESGVYEQMPRRKIHNTSARSDIPKLGFCHADAYCVTREVFLADMWAWGVNDFFCSSSVMREYTPDIANNLFVWSNFVDGELYRDYGESKLIPVLLTGSRATHYPWRNRVDAVISQHFASFTSPHFGWFDASKTGRMIYGEAYARLLNASWAVPACGTIAREVVRKHFEIPAAKACLFAEKTSALETAGFVDMHNCVFTDSVEIIDKLDYLFEHRNEFGEIIQNGYDLVHARHTLAHRNEIYQWYTLNKIRKPKERIVQPGPFQPLALAPQESGFVHGTDPLSGVDRILIREGDIHRDRGDYKKAEELYMRCLAYHYIPEASLRLAICKLLVGDDKAALYWLDKELAATVTKYGNVPDPVLWAYVLVAYVCNGQMRKAVMLMDKYPALRHCELTMVRQAIAILGWAGSYEAEEAMDCDLSHYSVHRLPSLSFADWVAQFGAMLRACKQPELARALSEKLVMTSRTFAAPERKIPGNYADPAKRVSSVPATMRFYQALNRVKMKGIRKFWAGLRRVEGYTRDFLPYKRSRRRLTGFCQTLELLLKDEEFMTIAVFGAVRGKIATDACFAACSEKVPAPSLFCLPRKTARDGQLCRYFIGGAIPKRENVLGISKGSRSSHCDVAVVDGTEWDNEEDIDIRDAKLIVLYDLTRRITSFIHQDLRSNSDYCLVAADLETTKGFAVYKRKLI